MVCWLTSMLGACAWSRVAMMCGAEELRSRQNGPNGFPVRRHNVTAFHTFTPSRSGTPFFFTSFPAFRSPNSTSLISQRPRSILIMAAIEKRILIRMRKEIKNLETSPPLGIVCFPLNDNIMRLQAGTGISPRSSCAKDLCSCIDWALCCISHFHRIHRPTRYTVCWRHVQDGDSHPGKVSQR